MFYRLIYIIIIFLLGCNKTLNEEIAFEPEVTTKANFYQTGYATWYGPGFHNRITASGEVYNMYFYTAAHRTLPLQTIIRVYNTENNKWIVVRINDRGPVKETLVLDLSKIAAADLDIIGKGSAKVKIEILTKSKNPLKRIFETYKNLYNQL